MIHKNKFYKYAKFDISRNGTSLTFFCYSLINFLFLCIRLHSFDANVIDLKNHVTFNDFAMETQSEWLELLKGYILGSSTILNFTIFINKKTPRLIPGSNIFQINIQILSSCFVSRSFDKTATTITPDQGRKPKANEWHCLWKVKIGYFVKAYFPWHLCIECDFY